jgi:hypothetical protein
MILIKAWHTHPGSSMLIVVCTGIAAMWSWSKLICHSYASDHLSKPWVYRLPDQSVAVKMILEAWLSKEGFPSILLGSRPPDTGSRWLPGLGVHHHSESGQLTLTLSYKSSQRALPNSWNMSRDSMRSSSVGNKNIMMPSAYRETRCLVCLTPSARNRFYPSAFLMFIYQTSIPKCFCVVEWV